MARHTEGNANAALGERLSGMMRGCNVIWERTRTIRGERGRHPDVLITALDRAPVVIEAEFMPARDVESEAKDRLGKEVEGASRIIEAVIALRYPTGIEYADDLGVDMADARLSYCVFTLEPDGADGAPVERRFPEAGWLDGSVSDVADMARLVSVPQSVVDEAANELERGIKWAVLVLDESTQSEPATLIRIANALGMSDGSQTRRMACAVVANAMVFHDRIAHMHPDITHLDALWQSAIDNPKVKVADEWNKVLMINYFPIFDVARQIVSSMFPHTAARILERLRGTAGRINALGANFGHDLTGRIFQRLIVDRKYLATFYTLPASAALLARLAVAKMDAVDWADADAVGKLRVGDFACGTGALLSAVYERFATLHENAGGDAAALHKTMMEDVLYGCDVMPSAIHITGATLSGIQPDVEYENSRLYTMPYGRQDDGTVVIGSLELLQSSAVMTLFNTSDPALRTGSVGEEAAEQVIAEIPDEGFDLVIMNPPFTRNTTHEGAYSDARMAAFAAFGASDADQEAMSNRMDILKKGTSYDGNAGMATVFPSLGHRKLKPGGTLALVLPVTAAVGSAWQKLRDMLVKCYTNLEIISISANEGDNAFSADTDVAECLVVGRKLRKRESPSNVVRYISIDRRPNGMVQASELAKEVVNTVDVRVLEEGPYGGSLISIGDEQMGAVASAKVTNLLSATFNLARTRDYSVAQTAYSLANSKLWLPGFASYIPLHTSPLGNLGAMGAYHLDLNGRPPRGAFDTVAPSPTSTYPALWNHRAREGKEKRIICEPDSQLMVRRGMEQKANELWETASRSHLTLDFRFTSQPLAVAFTERKSIGGTAWPNVIFDDERFDYAFSIWGNCTLGLLSFWWHSSRQHDGRGRTTIRAADPLPVLDLNSLSDAQLAKAEAIFEEFREREFKPAYLADADESRALLDRRVICDILGFGEDVYEGVRRLSAKWSAEPSVHGGAPHPRGSALVM